MRHAILAALLGAALLAGCGDDDNGSGGSGAAAEPRTTAKAAVPVDTVRIKDFEFEPATATVTAGRKISVPNADSAPHTLTDRPMGGKPMFDTGTLGGKQKGSFTAPKAGTYEVYCEIHPFMKGELEVVDS